MKVDRREFVKSTATAAGAVAATTAGVSHAQANGMGFDIDSSQFEYWQLTGTDDSSQSATVYTWKNVATGATAETTATCRDLRAWVGNQKPQIRCAVSC